MFSVLTANRLGDGEVVYLAPDGRWTATIDQAWMTDADADIAALTRLGAAAQDDQLVVGAYVIAVDRRDGHVEPLSTRERIRAAGPTTHPDHGKQALAAAR